MLREAGIPVELATLGVLDDGQVLEEVPSPWGTHAILLATIDGKQHWIDTTLSLAGWDFLPRDDRDRLCYVIDDKGDPPDAHAGRCGRRTTASSRRRTSGSAPTARRAASATATYYGGGRPGRSATPGWRCRPANGGGW